MMRDLLHHCRLSALGVCALLQASVRSSSSLPNHRRLSAATGSRVSPLTFSTPHVFLSARRTVLSSKNKRVLEREREPKQAVCTTRLIENKH